MATVALSGILRLGGDACGGGCATLGGGSLTTRSLELGPCGGAAHYQSSVQTGAALCVQTPGALGAVFEDLELLADLAAIELLYVKARGPVVLRIGAAAARVLGSGGVFPTGFAGAETLDLEIDGVTVPVVFAAGDQSAAAVVARINAAAALAGLATPRARVAANGQIELEGVLTGQAGALEVTGGTGAATLGLAGLEAVGAGADQRIDGLFLAQYDRAAAPARVQVSGQSSLEIVAAGRAA